MDLESVRKTVQFAFESTKRLDAVPNYKRSLSPVRTVLRTGCFLSGGSPRPVRVPSPFEKEFPQRELDQTKSPKDHFTFKPLFLFLFLFVKGVLS